MQLAHATRLGPYEILNPLGSGAMGEVYRARDSRLNRPVALKIIAAEAVGDMRRRRRFEQEARSASALNHPNIVTIYDIGIESGTSYLVSELVDGESLREVIRRGPLNMHRLLELAIQMADGLAAAHEAGIIHRDFKPENIMITRDGRVKILDFGLAKPLPALLSGETLESCEPPAATEPGMILGTVGYMSPEQASGQDAGIQADQFSFGVILHELATGQPAFKRDTPLETLLAIAKVDKKPFTPGPSGFRLLVDRLLAKDPAQRFASTAEISHRLRKIHAELPPEAEHVPHVQPSRRRATIRWRLQAGWVHALPFAWPVLLCGVAAALWFLQVPPPVQSAAPLEFTKLADEHPLQVWPAWAPDGKTLAYSADVGGQLQLFTQRVDGGAPVQITQGPQDHLYPVWAANGQSVYYVQPAGAARNLWRAGTWDGRAEMVQANVYQADLSQEGKAMAMLRESANDAGRLTLWTGSSPQAAPVRVTAAGWGERSFLAPSFVRVSPDHKAVALWATNLQGAAEMWLVPLSGGAPRQLPAPSTPPKWFAWADAQTLLVPSTGHLTRWAVAGQSSQTITLGPNQIESPAPSPVGAALTFASGDGAYRLQSVALSPGATPIAPQGLTGHSPAWSPTREEIAFAEDRQGRPGIWLRDADGDERQIAGPTQFGGQTAVWLGDISFSPHGYRLLFRCVTAQGSSLWIAPVHGQSSDPLPVAQGDSMPEPGGWSPDGNSIVFSALRQGRRMIVTQRVDGEDGAHVLQAGSDPRWSPAGNVIAFRDPGGRAMVMNVDGTGTRAVTSEPVLALTWDRQGKQLWFVAERDGRLWLKSEAGSEIDLGPRLASLAYAEATGGRAVDGLSFSADGRTVTLASYDMRAGLWLVSGWR